MCCFPGPVSTLGSPPDGFQTVFRGQVPCPGSNCASAYISQGARVPQRFGASQMFRMSVKFSSGTVYPQCRGPARCGQRHSDPGCSPWALVGKTPFSGQFHGDARVFCRKRVQSPPASERCRPGAAAGGGPATRPDERPGPKLVRGSESSRQGFANKPRKTAGLTRPWLADPYLWPVGGLKKKSTSSEELMLPSGGSDRRRSGDLSIFSRTLYQLSYRA
jgi:hypothetical protein